MSPRPAPIKSPLARRLACACMVAALLGALPARAGAQNTGTNTPTNTPTSMPGVGDVANVVDKALGGAAAKAGGWSEPVRLAIAFAGLALLPALLVMMTSFTRIVIVLGFVRRALTTQNIPPTIALIGLSLFLTLFTMAGTLTAMNQRAVQPFLQDKVSFEQACVTGNNLLKDFMFRQTRKSDLEFFVNMAGGPKPTSAADIPMHVAVPAFSISEFRTAFEMGCLLFIPFLLVDLVVSGILLSAGMMMLPPSIISLPFKIILFVLVDGWRLLTETLVRSFN
jgi:flagellar biosynthetic protein FliP